MNKFKYRCRIWRQIYPHFLMVKLWYGLDIVSEIILRITGMLFPVFYGIFLERVILKKELKYLFWVIGGYLLLQLVSSSVTVFQKNCQNRVNYTVSRKVRVFSLEKYFGLEFGAYDNLSTGDIKMTLEDAVNRLASFQTQLYRYFMNLVFITVMVVVLTSISWRLALVAFLFIPVTFLLDHLVSHGEKKLNDVTFQNNASWATWLDETIKSWKEIRINQYEGKRKKECEEFQEKDEAYHSAWLRFWVTRVLVIPKIKDDFMMQFVLYFMGGLLMYYHHLTIGMLLVFVRYYGMLSDSVKEVSESDANLQSEMPYYERIIGHLDREEGMYGDGTVLPERYDITFENVTFGYAAAEKNVLENLSFQVKEGERAGFYGESGVGKSTVLKLMLGCLEPDAGSIRYGGLSLKDICKKKLYGKIAYISQEARLFQESVLENLLLGKEDASMEEIEAACRRACIYDFILSLPDGFASPIGENGALLSGGQRQRLLLARALLRDADLYLLDEATSALDNQVEEAVIETLKEISREKTVIIIAHKEHFLELCDYVIRLG